MKNNKWLTNKVAIVTGAAQGIGRALAHELWTRGAIVHALDINITALREWASRYESRLITGQLDIRNAHEVATSIDSIVRLHGRIDYLFNNAGIAVAGESHEIPAEIWHNITNTNIMGSVNTICTAYPHMVRQRSGHIINMASLAGLTPVALLAPYSMTKYALVGLGETLRIEAARHGVRVSTVCPAAIETPLLDRPNDPVKGKEIWRPNVRRYLSNLAGKPQSPEVLARDILRKMRRNPNLIFSTLRSRGVYVLQRWLPGMVGYVGRYYLNRETKDRSRG